MSAAPKLAPQAEPIIAPPCTKPAPRPSTRPATKRWARVKAVAVLSTVWALAMALSFVLVEKNMAVRAETAAVAKMNGEIAQLEMLNTELDAKIANGVSVAAVEAWAKKNGLQPPSGAVQTLNGNPQAVASKAAPETAEAEAPASPTRGAAALWESVKQFVGRLGQSIQFARP